MAERSAAPLRAPSKLRVAQLPVLRKVATGISGFDDITQGGLPEGRTTLVCGGAGCGKTLFGMQFLIRGALDHGEPGVFVAFEETEQDLAKNVASLGFDVKDLERRKLLAFDHIRVERGEIEENGEYDLEGLFIRLALALDSVKAKRLVIDTLETIFGGMEKYGLLRSELKRLFNWLKERGITTIVTAERGDGTVTRHGLEEYVSDCVVLLDHRVSDQISTRRLRVVKYRGSTHGSNEYPFLIDRDGLTVVPITSSELDHDVSSERVDTGVPALNEMLGGAGYFKGSTVLVSGTAGSGKTSLAAHLVDATCRHGERALYVSFEESAAQILRNMRSIGLELSAHVKRGKLMIAAHRATSLGLEGHLAVMFKLARDFEPSCVVIDPVGTMAGAGNAYDAHLMLVRMIDFFKDRGITAFLTSLTHGGDATEATDMAVSSMVDTWILVRALETNGERTRALYVLKSRGMEHSNQVREFVITRQGVSLVEPYVGPAGVLTGIARVTQEAVEATAERERVAEQRRVQRLLEQKRTLLERRISELRAEFNAEEAALQASIKSAADSQEERLASRARMTSKRAGGVTTIDK
ncbi:MAG TPA: circadian clock protein KaiC, partial [Polyangiaceae bacterium]